MLTKFIVGWIGVGFFTWMILVGSIEVIIFLAKKHVEEDAQFERLCQQSEEVLNALMNPESVITSVFMGPILTLKFIMVFFK